jgi:RHS repeat-associated protein
VLGNPPEPQPEGSFGAQYRDKVPEDASLKSYDQERYILLTGLVRDESGDPLSGVRVKVLNHPEYGSTQTDESGRFSLPAEGGGIIKLAYSKPDYLTAHRKTHSPVQDVVTMDPVTLIQQDSASTKVEFNGDPDSVTTHQSTQVSDEFGSRSASMVFTGDNTAYALDKYGNRTRELDSITARATEYTTQDSMPAMLPPNSAYTYCAELTADEARRVEFEDPVTTYVDNFLGFEVGEAVPVGYYDRDRAEWLPAENGVVVRLLDTSGDGQVDALDADGDGQANDLNDSNSTRDEVTGLSGSSYQPGDTYWRFQVEHLTPWDCNWPYGPPMDAIDPNPKGVPTVDEKKEENLDCKTSTGSHVQNRSRILHEEIPIPGTDLSLHYASDRTPGYKTSISVPASGDSVPSSLKKIIVQCRIAGKNMRRTLDPLANQKAEFLWDGRDYEGDKVSTPVPARIRIGFVYDAVYYSSLDELRNAFAQAGDDPTNIQARQEIIYWKKNKISVEPQQAKLAGSIAAGWSISSHHQLNLQDLSTLHKGDGTKLKNNISNIITTVAGTGEQGYSGDGGPATEAKLYYSLEVAVDNQGNIFIADPYNHCIRKVDPSGTITTVAGTGERGYSGDGGPATQAKLYYPHGVAVDSQGNIFIADSFNYRIRKVDPSGTITTVAGSGEQGYSGDGGPATQAKLRNPQEIAVDSQGNIFIANPLKNCIRKVDPSGTITTVAGTGERGYSGDGGPATQARLSYPKGIAVDSQGNLFIADIGNYRIRKVDPSGIITTVAGTGEWGYSGDGGPATQAKLAMAEGIAVDSQGNIFIGGKSSIIHPKYNSLRKVNTSGTITTVAGPSDHGHSGDGGPATQAKLSTLHGVAVDSQGNIFIASEYNACIRKIGPLDMVSNFANSTDTVFADSNGQGYILDSTGKHQKTIDLDTGKTHKTFTYETFGDQELLAAITDQFGSQITINRYSDGTPYSIVSPDGVTTQLTVDASGHLSRITTPTGGTYNFTYTSDGLLTNKSEPDADSFQYSYNQIGRLTDTYDDHGGHWQFQRSAADDGTITTTVTTGEDNLTTYQDHTYSTGKYTSTITGPAGGVTEYVRSADGLSVDKDLSCGTDLHFAYDVDPEYKFDFIRKMTESTPSGLTRTTRRDISYEDTNSDDVPDLITRNQTVNGKTTLRRNDILSSTRTVTTPEGRETTISYDPDTLRTTSMNLPGLKGIDSTYFPNGKPKSVSRGSRETSFTYDVNGYLDSITTPQGRTTSFSKDASGRITRIDRPDGNSVTFSYDEDGSMLMLTNPENVDHEFDYNKVDKRSAYYTPLSGSYGYEYDTERKLTRITFPSGQQINNIYDKGRISRIKTPKSTIDYTYAPCGSKVASVSRGGNSASYTYDGKLVTSKELQGVLNTELSFTYNNDFRLTEMSYAGATESYSYDRDGLLTSAGDFSVTRNSENGLPEAISDSSYSQSRSFNGYGEISHRETAVAGYSLYSSDITRNKNGKITQKTVTLDGETHTYTYDYDELGRLTQVNKDGSVVEEYGYAADGTLISEHNTLRGTDRSLSYDEEDRLLTAGETQHQYSADGFLTEKTRGSNSTQYEYSSRGELLHVDLPGGTSIDYTYGPLGRRLAKSVNGTVTRKYLWQGLTQLLAVYDGSDNLLMRFEYADGRTPVAMTKGGEKYYLISNQVGSLRTVADSSGNLVKMIDYDSFGNVIRDTNPSFQIPFRFAGGLYDKHTGLIRFGHRDYDPATGRWTAKDPILFAGGDINLYGYCLNDPVNAVDHLGLRQYDPGHNIMNIYKSLHHGYQPPGVPRKVAKIIGKHSANSFIEFLVGQELKTVLPTGTIDKLLNPEERNMELRKPNNCIFK